MKVRKNDKAYLQDLKIDIHTDNDIYFQDLALFFDKERFLNLLPYLRKSYEVTRFFPLSDFEKSLDSSERGWFMEETKREINLSKYTRAKEVEEEFPEFYDFIHNPDNFLPETLDAECSLICYEFKRPPYFIDTIKQAIFCGAVDDTLFKPTEAKTVDFSLLGAWPALNQIAIFVSPISTYTDVEKEFRSAKEMMNSDEWVSYYHPHSDTTPNIRKYRGWYWNRIKGDTYQVIADRWVEKHEKENTTYLDILKALKIYNKLLTS
jgi:hypothetical protein